MPFRVWCLTVLAVAAVAACGAGPEGPPRSPPAARSDRITLPDVRREFHSPSGRFTFVVSTRDGWSSLRGTGELSSTKGSGRTLLWSRELPQQFGPRFVLVSDLGTTLMLDEGINVRTPYAVLVIDRGGRVVAQHSTDALEAALQVPARDVVRMARHGWWISAPPRLDATGDAARVETAGKVLTVRLSDGHLSVGPGPA